MHYFNKSHCLWVIMKICMTSRRAHGAAMKHWRETPGQSIRRSSHGRKHCLGIHSQFFQNSGPEDLNSPNGARTVLWIFYVLRPFWTLENRCASSLDLKTDRAPQKCTNGASDIAVNNWSSSWETVSVQTFGCVDLRPASTWRRLHSLSENGRVDHF